MSRYFMALSVIGLLASGCSLQYVDDGGVRHIWGLNHVQIKEAPGRSDVRAQQVTTVGVALIEVPQQRGFSLGYTRNFSLEVFSDTAGEISYHPGDPIGFSYKDSNAIWQEHN